MEEVCEARGKLPDRWAGPLDTHILPANASLGWLNLSALLWKSNETHIVTMQEMQLHAICMLDSHSIFLGKKNLETNLTCFFKLLSLSKWKNNISNHCFSNTFIFWKALPVYHINTMWCELICRYLTEAFVKQRIMLSQCDTHYFK